MNGTTAFVDNQARRQARRETPSKQNPLQICRPGADVLNVGFGLGLVDDALQALSPRTHVIVEAHPGAADD